MLISDRAKDVVKNCLEDGVSMSPFQLLVYIWDSELK